MTTESKNAEEEFKKEIKRLMRLKPMPLYQAVDRGLGDVFHPFMYYEMIICIASIYAGYSQNEDDDNIVGSIGHCLTKLSQVLQGLKNIMDRLDEVLRAIDAAVKQIERKVDRSFMQFHFNSMNNATNEILEIVEVLSLISPEKNHLGNPVVMQYWTRLQNARVRLEGAITGFASHDGGEIGAPPTVATIINCSSSVALFARAYMATNAYLEPHERVPIYKLKAHGDIKGLYAAFYVDAEKHEANANKLLAGLYLSPERTFTSRFENGSFAKSDIPVEDTYPPGSQYSGLYCRRDADPFQLYWTRPSYFGDAQKWVWQKVPEGSPSVAWDRQLTVLRRPILEFLATYQPMIQTKAEMMLGFEPHD